MATRMDTLADFSGRIGKRFEVNVADRHIELTLEVAEELPGSPRDGGGFRLEFVGPPSPMLTQNIFPFEIDGERFDLYIVPIGRDAEGTRYEAVFF